MAVVPQNHQSVEDLQEIIGKHGGIVGADRSHRSSPGYKDESQDGVHRALLQMTERP